MEITLGDATKLLDNIMANYSQWHTERSSSKKVHAIEEINVLSGKMDELMKLFPFSLRDRAKVWFSSLPKNNIDSWNKCKDAFIFKYFPPAKIITLRNDIMNFKQLDHEHVSQSWERMKLMIHNCPTHGLNLWMIIQKFYAGLNFASRNLLDSVAGGTFMEITLVDATKLLDNIMANYSQWHT